MYSRFFYSSFGFIASITFFVFVLFQILPETWMAVLYRYTVLHLSLTESLQTPWVYATALFVHPDFFHWLGNMLILFLLNELMKTMGEEKKLMPYFLAGGISSFLLTQTVFLLIHSEPQYARLAGCSASVFFIGTFYTLRYPSYSVGLMFLPSVPLKYFFVFLFLFSTALGGKQNIPGLIAHVSAVICGLIFFLLKEKTGLFSFVFPPKKNKTVSEKKLTENTAREERLNALLDKILAVGYENLSDNEKKELEKLSGKSEK